MRNHGTEMRNHGTEMRNHGTEMRSHSAEMRNYSAEMRNHSAVARKRDGGMKIHSAATKIQCSKGTVTGQSDRKGNPDRQRCDSADFPSLRLSRRNARRPIKTDPTVSPI
jgi:hypothetical protein